MTKYFPYFMTSVKFTQYSVKCYYINMGQPNCACKLLLLFPWIHKE